MLLWGDRKMRVKNSKKDGSKWGMGDMLNRVESNTKMKSLLRPLTILLVLFLLSSISCSKVSDGKETVKIEPVMFKVEPFTVKVSNRTGNSIIMKMTMEAELAEPDFVGKANAKTPALRDAVIMLLASKTHEDLVSPEGRLQLKDEINVRFNQILGDSAVSNIFITDILRQ